jgi:hypothetical protein
MIVRPQDYLVRLRPRDDTLYVSQSRADVKTFLRLSDERTRRFVETFTVMRQAYAEGAMAYGMFAARKAE